MAGTQRVGLPREKGRKALQAEAQNIAGGYPIPCLFPFYLPSFFITQILSFIFLSQQNTNKMSDYTMPGPVLNIYMSYFYLRLPII